MNSSLIIFFKEIEAAEGRVINRLNLLNPTGTIPDTLAEDIERAEKGVILYQAALMATEPIIGSIWNLLSPEDQRRFDCEYKTLWTIYRHPMPLLNAGKMLKLLRSNHAVGR